MRLLHGVQQPLRDWVLGAQVEANLDGDMGRITVQKARRKARPVAELFCPEGYVSSTMNSLFWTLQTTA
jgi:hypothetical protein